MDERYLTKRRAIEPIFSPENKLPERDASFISPSGGFQLTISHYSSGPKTWGYSRGVVTRLSDREVVADIRRNFDHFWHAWVQHPNGSEYLLCGEDYQGYSVVNLTSTAKHDYFSEEGHRGVGFCWVAVHPSPNGLTLAVDGCVWAAPYELVFYDFTIPDQLPLPVLARFASLGSVQGWVDENTLEFVREFDVRQSDGAAYDSLSPKDRDALDKDPSGIETRTETIRFSVPPLRRDA